MPIFSFPLTRPSRVRHVISATAVAAVLISLPIQLAAQAEATAAPVTQADEGSDRTDLNLLGEVDAEQGESRRNENVRITLIDNNVLRELTTRMGTTATVTSEFKVDQRYFATEFGQPVKRPIHQGSSLVSGVHGNLNWMHQNSVASARSFFQVGE